MMVAMAMAMAVTLSMAMRLNLVNPQRAVGHGQQVRPVLAAPSLTCLITKFDHTFHDHFVQMIMVMMILIITVITIYGTDNVSLQKRCS